MITIFGKTVYKVLVELEDKLVSPVFCFEYIPGKIYKRKQYEPGYYSWENKELAEKEITKFNYTGQLKLGIYKCKIPCFSRWNRAWWNEIRSEKIKIERRI